MSVVYVVHCIDTEGPLGGDARRLPDGSPEFFDRWDDIVASLAELTSPEFRTVHADSFGGPYRFNWFILDFTGFRTNPKHRVAEYHDTYDHLVALPTALDGIDWHYHAPPADGIGDRWAESWLESNEHNVILARRLLERASFPVAFRAGGTIEDDAANAWLEETLLLDFSNRASERSHPGADLFQFNWWGARQTWLPYHPSERSFLVPGGMRRFVYRSLDLRSRYNTVDLPMIESCFREVADTGEPRVLSLFSHDNRDMRAETYEVIDDLGEASRRTGVPWISCTAAEAHRRLHELDGTPLRLELVRDGHRVDLATDDVPFQRRPFVAAELGDGRFVRLAAEATGERAWRVGLPSHDVVRVGAAVTSSGAVSTVALEPVGS